MIRWPIILTLGSAALAGCIANSGDDPAMARIETAMAATAQATANAARDAVHTELSGIRTSLDDTSHRLNEVSQQSKVAVSKVDQSNSDKWVNRGMAIGLVLTVLGMIWQQRKMRGPRHGRI